MQISTSNSVMYNKEIMSRTSYTNVNVQLEPNIDGVKIDTEYRQFLQLDLFENEETL